MRGRILVVDDEPDILEILQAQLDARDYRVATAGTLADARRELESFDPDAVLTDHRLPDGEGITLCEELADADTPCILMTAFGSLELAVTALRAGAFDFLSKPLEMALVDRAVDRAVERTGLRTEVDRLRAELDTTRPLAEIIGESPAIQEARFLLNRAANTDLSVLLTGETGTGKDLAARALHAASPRREGPFLAVNCAALPDNLLESELFGVIKGAYTDARETREGLFVQASGGTLFLDEIGDMPAALQGKLLRALQARTVRPIGGDAEVAFDVRVVSATNTDLDQALQDGSFRRDLYYRLNVLEVELPPLRARNGDVLLLARVLLERICAREGRAVPRLSQGTVARLVAHAWPGNIRELENCLERATAMATGDTIEEEHLSDSVRAAPAQEPDPEAAPQEASPLLPLHKVEAQHVARVLAATGGNKLLAARILEIDRSTLYRKIDKYGIST